jgi:hypothetical protein
MMRLLCANESRWVEIETVSVRIKALGGGKQERFHGVYRPIAVSSLGDRYPINARHKGRKRNVNADPHSRVLAKDAKNAKELSLGGAAGGA